MNIKTLEVPIEDKSTDFNKVVKDSDSLETPPALFKMISNHFGGFNLDVAAIISNVKTPDKLISFLSGGLNEAWIAKRYDGLHPFSTYETKGRVWCNPPYSKPEPWLAKAYEETKIKRNAELAVLLLKFDCTTKMFAKYSDLADEIILLTGRRIRHIGRWLKPDGTLTINTSSRDSHCLFVFKG